MNERPVIILKDEEQEKIFRWLLKYTDLWKKVYYDIRPGSFTCHLDNGGNIRKVEINYTPQKDEFSPENPQV